MSDTGALSETRQPDVAAPATMSHLPLFEWLYLVCVASIPVMLPYVPVRNSSLIAADFIALLAFLALMAAIVRGKERRLPGRAYIPFVAFIATRVVTTIYSVDPWQSATKMLGMSLLVALALLSMHVTRRDGSARRLLLAWMTGAAITVVFTAVAIVLYYTGHADSNLLGGYGSLPPAGYPRPSGLFNHFNLACSFLSMTAVVLVAMQEAGWIPHRISKWLLVGCVISAIATISPGIGGLVFGVALYAFLRARRERPFPARVALTVGIAAAVFMLVAVSISPIVTASNPDFNLPLLKGKVQPSSRFLCWIDAWHKFRAHPWFGHGIGVPSATVDYLDAAGDWEHLEDAHNLYLSLLAKTGILGLASFLWVVLSALHVRGKCNLPVPVRTAIVVSIVQAVFYQGTAGSFEYARHVWVLLGVVGAPAHKPD